MINIKLYNNKSANNVIAKSITQIVSTDCTLKENVDILKPELILKSTFSILKQCNYCYINNFNRYYYIDNIEIMRNEIFKLSLSVDVLMSFKDEILNCNGIIKRQTNDYNLYLNDGSLKVYQNPHIVTKPFPNGFTGSSYVLAIAGS